MGRFDAATFPDLSGGGTITRIPSLAVIVIARNEQLTIESCLRSCIEAVRRATDRGLIRESEVVLVDSASTDRTREIASTLPVNIISIPRNWPLSAAAGRFVGLRQTHSEAVLFVDGDYTLGPDWLGVGLEALLNPGVAGVCGVDEESLEGRNAISRYVLEATEKTVPAGDLVDTEAISVGLYWRNWIERAGGIQPFLQGAEDRDLGIRVRVLGGRLVKTRAKMGTHYWAPGEALTLVGYFRSVAKWSYGEGQAARLATDEGRIRKYYFSRYFHARHLIQLEEAVALIAWTCGFATSAILGAFLVATGLLLGMMIALAVISILEGERITATIFGLHAIPYAVIRLGCFGLGYANRPKPASRYPSGPLSNRP